MSRGPQVSVITIFLNGAPYLHDAVESVFGQTYPNWELLLVDDGSTDASSAIARHYAEEDPGTVRYLEHDGHQNRGMSASRNLGVASARGNLIAFIDADDVWLPHKLAHQVAIIGARPDVALVLNPSDYWDADRGVRGKRQMTLEPGYHSPGAWPQRMAENDENVATTCGILVRKDILDGIGGFEESFRGLFVNMVACYKIGLRAPIYFDPEPVALYRQHGASCWQASTADDRLLARLKFDEWLEVHLKTQYGGRLGSVLSTARTTFGSRLFLTLLRELVDDGQHAAAIATARGRELLVAEPPLDGEWHYLVAYCLHQLRTRLPEALHRYHLALDCGFDEFWVRYNRGDLYCHIGRLTQAVDDLRRAVELRPDHDGARQLLGQLSGSRGAVPLATRSLRERLRLGGPRPRP